MRSNQASSKRAGRPRWQCAALFAFVLAASGVPALAAPATCLRADIPHAFELPDGTRHPGGVLRICPLDRFTPSAGLQVLYVDGSAMGAFLTDTRRAEGSPGDEPTFVFTRGRGDAWVLQAYASAEDERSLVHWFRPNGARKPAHAVEGEPLLVAARWMP